ncbi:MAG: S1C family serine protease [Synergistaceae bacterium]|jgi:serine protease Do|nr:S1C family serine protease [Synergistaceae bacterium]
MRRLRYALCIALSLVCILLAPIRANAIGFDVETIYKSVVVVYSYNYNSVGSGFAISGHRVVTNAHVIANADSVVIKTYAGDKYGANVEAVDTALDIAVLNINGTSFVPLKIADENLSKVGDDVYVVGAPNGMAYSLAKGVLSAKNRRIGSRAYLQSDAAVNSGNSGGPLLNENGEVLGMNTLKIADSEGIGLAISMTTIEEYISNGNKNTAQANPDDSSEGSRLLPPVENKERSSISNGTQNNNSVLMVLLCCSGLLNIILVTVLAYSRMKPSQRKPNASERIDFEIDILK